MAEQVEKRDTIIVGGGQAGLAMSYLLTQQDRDHVVLEKGQRIGESWRGRWDSFTLVTPNWQLQLPGFPYQGDDPEGFLTRDEVVRYLEEYADTFDPPLRFGVEVTAIEENDDGDGYLVHTTDRAYEAANVVVAVGAFQYPHIPAFSQDAPEEIVQLHSSKYRNPEALPEGGVLVVGSGQSGCQIAQELNESGRQVYLCTSGVGRLPRRYRGKDGMWWGVQLGMTDRTVDDLESPEERFAANPQISGKDGGQDINLHQFARDGIRLLGRLEDFRGQEAILAPDLHQNLAISDKMAAEFRKGVDKLVSKKGLDVPEESVTELQDGYEQQVITELDLEEAGIGVILWATGFDRDFSWIELPIFDEWDYPIQERGVTEYPGLYFLGLHWLHTLKSGLFLGVGDDAEHIAEHIARRTADEEASKMVTEAAAQV
ncbi:MAG: NAD(P)-binding domain-containing protein [Candidatus Promineifilaceae bacterium]|nr:NAD(P)-binding domain-containing protein [Candidatus Promineifilaceae bacterium]